jgi:polyferredoxin
MSTATPTRRDECVTAAAPTPDDEAPKTGRNLLELRPVAAIVRSRWYPAVFRVPVAAVFGLVAYQLIAGPWEAHDNAGTALMWVLWWPLVPIVFVALGRLWCAVCPFGWLSDLVQKAVGANRPVPAFLKRYGVWIIDGSFLLITWADHVWGVVENPWGSAVLLLLLTTAVIVSGAFFQRRTFCRYLCFLGGLAGNYSRAGALQLRANTDICAGCKSRAACYNGRTVGGKQIPGCPMFVFPRTMDSSADCNLCGNCVKACPNDAIEIRLRKPSSELWFVRTPKLEQSFLAAAIMGIVLVQNLTMLGIWTRVLAWLERTTGITSYALIFTVVFAAAVAVPVALLYAASRYAAARNADTTRANFARFGYALIPLDVAAHVAHNLFHLLAEGKSVAYTLGAMVTGTHADGSPMIVSAGTIQVLQYVLLAAGAAGSLYAAWRIAARRYRNPTRRSATFRAYAAALIALTAVNVWLFALPMTMRM